MEVVLYKNPSVELRSVLKDITTVRLFNVSPQTVECGVGERAIVKSKKIEVPRVCIYFKEAIFTQKYKAIKYDNKFIILAIFPSYVDVADLNEAEKELEAEFGKLVKE
jgi:hypothetical protein